MPIQTRRPDPDERHTHRHRVDVHFHGLPPIGGGDASLHTKLDSILSALATSAIREIKMELDFTSLINSVDSLEGTVASGEEALGKLGAEIVRLAALVRDGDPTAAAKIEELGTKVTNLKTRLAQAIASNPVPGEGVPPPVDPASRSRR